MSFNGNEGMQITLQQGAALTKNFRTSSETRIAVFYGVNKLQDILSQQGCMGIRFYFARDAQGRIQLVLVGADANENDMISGIIVDSGTGCPEECSSSNPLNTD